jgi:predicted ribosome quality control (RQC) complex YloA/Tae2 family protein
MQSASQERRQVRYPPERIQTNLEPSQEEEMNEVFKNKSTDIKHTLERIEVLLSTAAEELAYAKRIAPEDVLESLRAQNKELYKENALLRQKNRIFMKSLTAKVVEP